MDKLNFQASSLKTNLANTGSPTTINLGSSFNERSLASLSTNFSNTHTVSKKHFPNQLMSTVLLLTAKELQVKNCTYLVDFGEGQDDECSASPRLYYNGTKFWIDSTECGVP